MSLIILNVDEVRRTLSASGGAFVVHDKEVDIVRFVINSGFADIVLDGQVALRVMYQRPGETEVRAQTLTYHDTDGLRNYYDWQLLSADLAEKGALTVALCILRTDSEVEEWHTTPCQVRVLGTIHTDDSDEGDESITPTVAQRVAVLETMIQRVASGAPIVVASTSAMTDTDQIYVLSTDGNWYYHNGSAWVAGGEYGGVTAGSITTNKLADGAVTTDKIADGAITTTKIADGAVTANKIASGVIPTTDTTLTQANVPADAKAVGDTLDTVSASLQTKLQYANSGATTLKNCDLDDITTTGSYRITSIANANTVDNIPTKQGGVLLVFNLQASALAWQRYIVPTQGKGLLIYDRVRYSDVWRTWYKATTEFERVRLLPIHEDEYACLSTGDDLNDITTVGAYKSTSASVTSTLLHKPPINIGFLLIVTHIVDTTSLMQVVKAASDGRVYLRYINTSSETYGEWRPLAYDDVDIDNTLAALERSIANNSSRISVLEARSGIESDYFTQYEEQEQALYDKVNSDIDNNTLVFVMSADNHYRETKPEGEYQVYHAEIMAKIAKRLRADAIINLGDIITQYIDSIDDEVYAETSVTAEQVQATRLAKMATAFQSTGVPFLYTLAHHEQYLHTNSPSSTDNTMQTSTYPYPASKVLGLCGKGAEWLEEHHYTLDPMSAGYYVDFDRQKVRVIIYNSVGYTATGFSPDAIAFISEAFSTVPSGYKVLVCTHVASRYPGVYSSEVKNGAQVEAIMQNFVSGGGTILAEIHGHSHFDNVVYIENIPYPYVCICCAENSWSTVGEKIEAGVLGNPTSYKAHSATRGAAIGTYNEWLFDVACVHPDRDTINFFRFGIGEDRTVTVGGGS